MPRVLAKMQNEATEASCCPEESCGLRCATPAGVAQRSPRDAWDVRKCSTMFRNVQRASKSAKRTHRANPKRERTQTNPTKTGQKPSPCAANADCGIGRAIVDYETNPLM